MSIAEMFLLYLLPGSITFGVSGNAQALNTLIKSAPVGRASERVELSDVQSAPKFGAVDVGAYALRLRASSVLKKITYLGVHMRPKLRLGGRTGSSP